MGERIEVIYENGVFRPLGPVPGRFQEQQRLTVTVESVTKPQPVPGRCRGMLTVLAEDDEHLKDWAEYLP